MFQRRISLLPQKRKETSSLLSRKRKERSFLLTKVTRQRMSKNKTVQLQYTAQSVMWHFMSKVEIVNVKNATNIIGFHGMYTISKIHQNRL